MAIQGNTLAEEWGMHDARRRGKLERLRKLSALTLPWVLLPESGEFQENQALNQSYQSLGQLGVANLKSALISTLFPTGQPWFRGVLTEQFRQENAQVVPVADAMLGFADQSMHRHQETTDFRSAMGMVLEQMIVVGQGLFRLNRDYTHTVWTMDQFVTRRNLEGQVMQHIIKDKIDPWMLSKEDQAKLKFDPVGADPNGPTVSNELLVPMFTRVRWEPESKKWTVLQQIQNGEIVQEGEHDVNPYISPRWTPAPRFDYGIGLIEQIMSDLISFDGIHRAIMEGASSAARCVMLVDPAGTTNRQALARADNLAIIYGRAQDVDFVQTNKQADLRVAFEVAQMIEQRLGRAMGLFNSVRRDAERVTQEEIGRTVQEIESVFGGVLTTVKHELQEAYLARYLWQAQNPEAGQPQLIDRIDPNSVTYEVTSGASALARSFELQKNLAALQAAGQVPGFGERINPQGVAAMIFTNLGVDPNGLVKSDEQVQAEQQAAQAQQLQQNVQQQAVQSAGNIAEQQAAQPPAAA